MKVMKMTSTRARNVLTALTLALATAGLGACSSLDQTYTRGYVLQEGALEQIPVGATRDQVTFVLGSPSTIATIEGDVFYYITQQVLRRPFSGDNVTDQRVLAVYFDKNQRVQRIGNYGMQDGKIFDFVARKTATGGKDTTFLNQIFQNLFKSGG